MAGRRSNSFRNWLLAVISLIFTCGESRLNCHFSSSVCGSTLLDAYDSKILLELKAHIHPIGEPIFEPFGEDWKTSLTCDKGWSGICTDRKGRVAEIDFSGIYLDESIGTIPESIGNLSKLLYLDFSVLSFPSLPSTIGSLSNLENLGLRSNALRSLPPSLISLTKLTRLVLDGCSLNQSAIPTINKLINLSILSLSENVFTSLPSSAFKSLIKLTSLNLLYNRGLRYTPIPTFNTLTSLEYLDLGFCGFSGTIPMSYASFKNLTTLYLDNNNLCGTLPSYLATLPLLRIFSVKKNFLTGLIPPKLAQNVCNDSSGGFNDNCLIPSKTCNSFALPKYKCTNGCNPFKDIINDIALSGSSTQSTTHWYGYSSAAIDGSAGHGNFFSRSCSHTWNQTNPWLRIEIRAHVKSVQLYNRLDCCSDRLNGVQVYVGNSSSAFNAPGNVACTDPKFKYGDMSKGYPLKITCNKVGLFLWVVVPGKRKILSVCEAVILGSYV